MIIIVQCLATINFILIVLILLEIKQLKTDIFEEFQRCDRNFIKIKDFLNNKKKS